MENKELEMMENQDINEEMDLEPVDDIEMAEKLDWKNGALIGLAVAGGIAIVTCTVESGKWAKKKFNAWKANRHAKKAAESSNQDDEPVTVYSPEEDED